MLGAELMYHLMNVATLTAFVAGIVLWRYRVAVLDGMRVASGAVLPGPVAIAGDRPSAGILTHAPALSASSELGAAVAWERSARRRLSAVYLLSVGLSALTLSLVYFAQSALPLSPSSLAAQVAITMSAAVPMIAVTLATPFWRAFRYWLLLLLAGVVLAMLLSLLQRALLGKAPNLQVFTLAGYFAGLAASQLWEPFVLLLATGAKKLRGVAPITFAGLLVFGLAPLAGSKLTQALAASEGGSGWALRLGLNGVFVLLALPVAGLAWWRLRLLAEAYEKKRFSDAQLLADTWWLIFVAVTAIELIIVRPGQLLSFGGCALAYVMFRPLNRYLMAHAGLERGRPAPRTLLVLRVFGYQSRTERLFDRVVARWRLFGPVTMIAAPDVIARTVDPAEFLRFIAGRIGDSFVRSQADLDARLKDLDLAPDPDGRYRMSEFCCQDNTWQATVVALMQRADAVIMDVRGVTAERRGCEYELQQLAERLPAEKVVLVTDKTTDRNVIVQATANRSSAMRLVPVESNSIVETDRLFESLLEAALLPGVLRS